MKKILIVLLILFSTNVFSKFLLEPTDKLVKRVVSQSDTVFVGKVLGKKIIKNGLILNDKFSSVFDVGVWEVEVRKVFRGEFHVGDKRLICSWINATEYNISLEKGVEYVFAGVETGKYIQLPGLHGRILPSTGLENEIDQGLKLPITVKYDKKSVNILYDDQVNAVKRDACYEDQSREFTTEKSSKTP